jgi:thymidylate synthase (FAD)
MQVEVLESTNKAEKLMCVAARGDYMSDWNAEKSFENIMSDVSYDDDHLERARSNNHYSAESDETEAKMVAFIEKQLSRGHYGPAEHPQITFAVEGVSRVTMAQITRHRHMTFDIQSMRYADFSEQEIVTPQSLRDEQHFSRETGLVDVDDRDELRDEYEETVDELVSLYERLVRSGVPKEDARFILPLGTTVNMTFSGNARTFMHLLDMRAKANAQWEIRELSEMLIEELKDWMPYSYQHYDDNAPHKLAP